MKRLGFGALMVAVVLSLGIVVVGRYAMPERAYTVAEVVDGLRHEPGQWAGRTVLVRGIVTGGSATSVCAHGAGAFGVSCTRQAWMTLGTIAVSTGPARWIASLSAAPVRPLSGRVRLLGTNGGGFVVANPAIRPPYLVPVRGHQAPLLPPNVRWRGPRWPRRGPPSSFFAVAFRPAEELTVSVRPGSLPLTTRVQQALPAAAYTLPVIGPLVSRFFPRDGSHVYRVRLLDPRACSAQAFAPCADATLTS